MESATINGEESSYDCCNMPRLLHNPENRNKSNVERIFNDESVRLFAFVTVMSAFDTHNAFGAVPQGDAKWKKLNADHGGQLEERVRLFRDRPERFTHTEAQVIALALSGMDCMASAIVLGCDEHTVENHRSNIRRKLGKPRKGGEDFDLLFPPPPGKNEN